MGWKRGKKLELETERFILRSLTPADADETYTSWWNDAELQRGFNSKPRNWDTSQAARHLRQFNNDNRFHLGIFCKETGKLIGFIAMFPKYRQKLAKTNVLIGDQSYWGKGVPREVRRHMLDFLFDTLGMEKVEGEIFGRNLPSIFNYQALGFKAEGVRRSHVRSVDGGRADVYQFGLLKEEWQAFKKEEGAKQ